MGFVGGAAKRSLQPKIGTDLIGYSQTQHTIGIHDPLYARALVLSDGVTSIALCSVEVCLIPAIIVKQIREAVQQRCDVQQVYVFATHTHAAPALHLAEVWEASPIERIADAIAAAYGQIQPVTLAAGFGQVQGYSINRRFLHRPIEPAVGVVRVESADGQPLAVLGNVANHAVVLGYDNDQVSGDWPGMASTFLEDSFGDGFVALFSQGGSGDINPLTEGVRQQLEAGYPVSAIGDISTMYGTQDDAHAWNIGDRAGGTFAEARVIAEAYQREIMRVWPALKPTVPDKLVAQAIIVNGAPDPDEPPLPESERRDFFRKIMPEIGDESIPMEIMLVRCDSLLLVGQPGEVFSENAVQMRKTYQQLGIDHPILVTNANGWYGYLVPENAYAEGGYEVQMAQSMGLSRRVQDRIWQAVHPLVAENHIKDG